MVNSKTLFYYNRYYYLLVVLPILSNHIGLVLSNHPASPPYPRTESTLGTRDTQLLYFFHTKTRIKQSRESLILLIGLPYLFALLLSQLMRTNMRIITRKNRTNLARRELLRGDTKIRKGNAGLGSHLWLLTYSQFHQ
jgi:hypothetical protein